MSNPLEHLAIFAQFVNKHSPHLNHFSELYSKVMSFAFQNSKLLTAFANTFNRKYDADAYSRTIRSTMDEKLLKCFNNECITDDGGVYDFTIVFASYKDGPLWEYSHEEEVPDMEDPQLEADFPTSDGWEADDDYGRGRRRREKWFTESEKAFREWMPVVEAKLKETFPKDTIAVKYLEEDFYGVSITIF